MQFLIAAISLGFLGSFHCIGMCGPIALALPVHHKPAPIKYLLIVLYNLGRIITYSLFGLLAGIVGKSFVLAGFQQGLSVVIGITLLLSVLFSFKNNAGGYSFFIWIKGNLSKLFSKGTKPSLFLIGILNGFLPCGLVYMGIAGAAATGDVLKGVLFMAVFGVGTLPMMLFVPLAGSYITVPLRNMMRKATPVIVTAMAVLLILRGLNLGIPYVSPKIDKMSGEVSCHTIKKDCCHKK